LTEAIFWRTNSLINTSCVCGHKAQRSRARLYELIKPENDLRDVCLRRAREKTTFIKRKKINRANLRLLSFAIQTPKLGRRAAPSIFSAQTKHRETRRLVKFHSHDCIAERELRVKLIRTLSRNKGGRGRLIVAQRPNRPVALAEEHLFVLEKQEL
jgi:hypothetical protein